MLKFSMSKKPMIGVADKVMSAVERETKQAVAAATTSIHATIIKSINRHQSSGETYGKHTASKPGFPPNTDTGALAASIKMQFDNEDGTFTGIVGTNSPYAAGLEFGTSNIAPRPFFGPAFRDEKEKFIKRTKSKSDSNPFWKGIKKGAK